MAIRNPRPRAAGADRTHGNHRSLVLPPAAIFLCLCKVRWKRSAPGKTIGFPGTDRQKTVIPRPVLRLVVGIRSQKVPFLSSLQKKRWVLNADCHASDIGHRCGNDSVFASAYGMSQNGSYFVCRFASSRTPTPTERCKFRACGAGMTLIRHGFAVPPSPRGKALAAARCGLRALQTSS